MSKQSSTGVNVGGVSILMIFVLLCLTTFATLSLVSANADRKLTRRSADASTAYYAADAAAEGTLAAIDQALASSAGAADYLGACERALALTEGVTVDRTPEGMNVSWETPIDDQRTLHASLEVLPKPPAGERYRLLAWQPVRTGDWQPDDSIKLWDGEAPLGLSETGLPAVGE